MNVDQAFLVLQEDGRWHDVYRLIPGLELTIGRDSTNRLVIPTEKCSRRHCEINATPDGWFLRDLGSSNGTQLNGNKISGQVKLNDGDFIRVGGRDLLFTRELGRPMGSGTCSMENASGADAAMDASLRRRKREKEDGTEILQEKNRSRYCDPASAEGDLSRGFSALYRLVSNMVTANDHSTLATTVLDGLFHVLNPDIGAVLLLTEPVNATQTARSDDLNLVAWRSPDDKPYHRVSERLSAAALRSGNGTLAMNVANDAVGGSFQTLATMNAQSVLCVPVRTANAIFGLIHLYCLNPARSMDQESLEFALAVAQHMGELLEQLTRQEALTAGLKKAHDEMQSLRELLTIESDLIGSSPSMLTLRDEIARLSQMDSTVLIRGESGTGKELVARAMHFNSPRKTGPYISMNCAALTESLLESELFGHEKGAFTGATERKIGKFEQAHGGTLFLDEVGEMSQSVQTRFLRVLEGHPFERVGGQTSVKVDVRVVAATNRDLEQGVREGSFRLDLFFRLNILDIKVPPLRARRNDIEALATHFLNVASRRQGLPQKRFAPETLARLCDYEWPGNVRELRNVIERAFAMAADDIIAPCDIRLSHLDDGIPREADSRDPYQPLSVDELERRHIEATLRYTNWVKREAARILGIERSTLDRKLKSYGIDRPDAD